MFMVFMIITGVAVIAVVIVIVIVVRVIVFVIMGTVRVTRMIVSMVVRMAMAMIMSMMRMAKSQDTNEVDRQPKHTDNHELTQPLHVAA